MARTVLRFRDLPDFKGVVSSVSVAFLLAVTLQTSYHLALSSSLYGRPARGADLYGFSAPLRMFRSISWIVRVTVVGGVPVCAEIDFFKRPVIYRT